MSEVIRNREILRDNIIMLREKQQMTQQDLADQSGVSLSIITRLEGKEKYNPSFETLVKVSASLGGSLYELFSDEKEEDDDMRENLDVISNNRKRLGEEIFAFSNDVKKAKEQLLHMLYRDIKMASLALKKSQEKENQVLYLNQQEGTEIPEEFKLKARVFDCEFWPQEEEVDFIVVDVDIIDYKTGHIWYYDGIRSGEFRLFKAGEM